MGLSALFSLITREMSPNLSQDFIQVLENGIERIVHKRFADSASDSDCAGKFGVRIIGHERATGLIGDVDISDCVNRAAPALAFHAQHNQIGVLALDEIDDHGIGTFQARQRDIHIDLEARGIQQCHRLAAGDALLKDRWVKDSIENASAIRFELVCSVEFHETLPSTTEIHRYKRSELAVLTRAYLYLFWEIEHWLASGILFYHHEHSILATIDTTYSRCI